METKPIKRSSQLLPVSREHHFGLLFCWKIRQGITKSVDVERMLKYVQFFFKGHLEYHFEEEERLLFIDKSDMLVQSAISQHAELRSQCENLLLCDTRSVSREQLIRLADDLDEHIRFEERILFPHLEQVLSPGHLNWVDNCLHDHGRNAFIDNYPDVFWLNQSASL